jgi:hypothetical protein
MDCCSSGIHHALLFSCLPSICTHTHTHTHTHTYIHTYTHNHTHNHSSHNHNHSNHNQSIKPTLTNMHAVSLSLSSDTPTTATRQTRQVNKHAYAQQTYAQPPTTWDSRNLPHLYSHLHPLFVLWLGMLVWSVCGGETSL